MYRYILYLSFPFCHCKRQIEKNNDKSFAFCFYHLVKLFILFIHSFLAFLSFHIQLLHPVLNSFMSWSLFFKLGMYYIINQ